MEAAIAQRVQYPSWVDCRKFEGKPLGSLRFAQRVKEEKRFRGLVALAHLQPDRRNDQLRSVSSEVSCSDNNSSGSCESTSGLLLSVSNKGKSHSIFVVFCSIVGGGKCSSI